MAESPERIGSTESGVLKPEPLMAERYTTVSDFYKDARIFLTGATGFMGKVLLFTLLRHFPAIDTVYILVRTRRGVSPEQRIENMFENVIFDVLKREAPGFKAKVKVIEGNLEADNIGISPESFAELSRRVNIIFHCAATLRFDEDLKVAIRTNVCSTQTIVRLAKSCHQLRLFTYVSTAFSNANVKTIEERIYTPTTHYTSLICLLRLGDTEQHEYESLRTRLATENVNTYTLTKSAAEQLISEEAMGIPVSIFRPSIVIATSKEPVPGYIDNLYGPTGLVSGVMAGVVRPIHCEPRARADLVPVDMAVNALVCSAWLSGNRYEREESPALPVYNYVSSTDNPITWQEFSSKSFSAACRMPSSKTLWCYCHSITRRRNLYMLRNLIQHYLVGYILDLGARLMNSKLRLIPIYRKLDKLITVLEPFSTNEWVFHNTNVNAIWSRLSAEDRLKFPFHIVDLDWDTYLDSYVKGILVHQLHDKIDPETRKYALLRYKRLEMAHRCLKVVVHCFVIFFIWEMCRLTGILQI